jgi:HK97 family phage prohead protease
MSTAVTQPGNYEFVSEQADFKAFTEEDENGETQHYVKGYISTHDEDLVNDIVTEKGMENMLKQIREHNIKIDFEHEAWRSEVGDIEDEEAAKTTNPVGRIVEAERNEKGIKAKVLVNKAHRRFEEVWGSIKEKMLDAFSIAFTVPDGGSRKATNSEGEKVRLLDKIKLLNVAFTGNPVNRAAKMTDVMTKARNDIMELNELKSRVEELEENEENLKNRLEELKNNDTMGQNDPENKGNNPDQDSDTETEVKSEVEELKDMVSELKSQIEQESKSEQEEQEEKAGDYDGEEEEEEEEEMKALKEEIKGLKETLNQPERKGVQTPEHEEGQPEQKSQGPLDYVA